MARQEKVKIEGQIASASHHCCFHKVGSVFKLYLLNGNRLNAASARQTIYSDLHYLFGQRDLDMNTTTGEVGTSHKATAMYSHNPGLRMCL